MSEPAIDKLFSGTPIPADVGKIATAIGLLSSVIKSGEAWSESCERATTEAYDALRRLGARPAADGGQIMAAILSVRDTSPDTDYTLPENKAQWNAAVDRVEQAVRRTQKDWL